VRITFEEICLPAIKADWVCEMEAGSWKEGVKSSSGKENMVVNRKNQGKGTQQN
jgi:hypothetical protein